VRGAQTIDTPDVRIASDHLPVLADLELPGPH
jgi:endonuclease/exonuclease/phosphatase family metal-dependent hydrolase